ncbi:hypothetical protein HDV05_008360 [Chytridiales sp. JEL 0842]|nr:hypothetical protein HDV05_008360 [Chytridiales sp. JEL 0842]
MSNILLIGGGGREHALAWGLAKSPNVAKVFVAPGNGGTGKTNSKIVNVSLANFDAMKQFALENNVSLVVPGPEQPLVDGISTVFKKVGIPVFGPSAEAAKIEGSKAFSKDFMRRHNIPTAAYGVFTDFETAKKYMESTYKGGDLVIKASGLAAGKGVLLPETMQEAIEGLKSIMVSKEFGTAGDEVVIEERLEGEEVSVLAFTDGYTVVPCPGAQDHKRVNEGDKGPNTGGMGAYAPAPIYTPSLQKEVYNTILKPSVDGMRKDRVPFVGILYVGLILTKDGPKVLEYNCRFGDPETQVVIPLLESDLAEVMLAAAEGRLDSVDVKFKNATAATVVVAAGGYPGSYPKGKEISFKPTPEDVIVFHAGTQATGDTVVTSGGRVLAVTATADKLEDAIARAVDSVKLVSFENMHYRKDIGHRALKLISSKEAKGTTYADAGVSIDAGNLLVEKIKPLVKATRRSGADADIGGFGGVFDLSASGYGDDTLLVSGTDGVGTKLKIAHAANYHTTIGIDLVAMSVNDVLVQGAEPLFFLDYYACSKLEVDVAKDVVAGIASGCIESGCALIGGETAEMPGMYVPGDYDLAGFVVGAVKRDQLLPKMDLIVPGEDVLLGLPSSGIHSNGYSLVRHIISNAGLSYSSPCPWSPEETVGRALLVPTRLYVKPLLPILRRGLVKALSHITGGGFIDNIPRCLPKGVGVEIDARTWELPPVFKWLKKQGNVTDYELSRTFNCGIGMVLVVSASDVPEIIKLISEVNAGPVIQMGRVVKVADKEEEAEARHLTANLPSYGVEVILQANTSEFDAYKKSLYEENQWRVRFARDRTMKAPKDLQQVVWRRSGELIGNASDYFKLLLFFFLLLLLSMGFTLEELSAKYELGDTLGSGAFSEVKRATERATGNKYAIKIIDKAKCKGKESMIETEVNILVKVRHENIIQLYEMFEIDNKIYLVMELVTGGELFDDIVSRGKYTEVDAAKIVHKMLLAIDYLHSLGIAHRDLKPENLLLSHKGADAKIMISDFGLSKIFDEDEVMKTACGTPGYVAPEVLRKKGYGREVDLWSLGVITYILLCGYPPFYDQNNVALFKQIMSGKYEFDRPWWDNISEKAKDFIRHLLVLDPAQRYTARMALNHPYIVDNCGSFDSSNKPTAALRGTAPANSSLPQAKSKEFSNKEAQQQQQANFTSSQSIAQASGSSRTAAGNLAPGIQSNLIRSYSSKSAMKVPSSSSTQRPSSAQPRAERCAEGEQPGRPLSARTPVDDSGIVASNDSVNKSKGQYLDAAQCESRPSTQSTRTVVNSESRPGSTTTPNTRPGTALSTRVKVLSYNLFLRPPGIKNNASDHKNVRLNIFGSSFLQGYDVVCLQEVFAYGSSRLNKLLAYAKKSGLEYFTASPSKGLLNATVDGGLLILSRFPIVKTEKVTFKRGIYGDRFTAKGAIYARISITPSQHVHVFNVHMQSSATTSSLSSIQSPDSAVEASNNSLNSSNTTTTDSVTGIRLLQMAALKDFIDDCMRNNPGEPAIVAGGLNVNARSCKASGKSHSDEYVTMMRLLKGDIIVTGGHSNQIPTNPLRLNVSDLIYEANGKEHPITYGDVVEPGKDHRPVETTLTASDGLGACGSIDYILWLTERNRNSTARDHESDEERSVIKSNNGKAVLDLKGTRVERFLVEGEPFTQLSDHYGISTVVNVAIH